MAKDYAVFESAIGFSFKDKELLIEALTHSSYINECRFDIGNCYERLEFLGDAILEFVSSEYLYHLHTNEREGDLSKKRASLVCEKSLAAVARKLNLGSYLRLGKGETLSGGADKDSILCDVVEAVIGAIYLDGGFSPAKAFIDRFVLLGNEGYHKDYKSQIQEYYQSFNDVTLEYRLKEERGPAHNRTFVIELVVDGNVVGIGEGSSKKQAEQAAAASAFKKIK